MGTADVALPCVGGAGPESTASGPLRVAFFDYVVDGDRPGRSGLSDIVWDMASELVELGHLPHIVSSYTTADYPDSRIPVHHYQMPRMGTRNPLGQFLQVKCAAPLIRALDPDIIHCPEYTSTALLSYWLPKTPIVMTTPGNIYHRLSVKEGSSYEWYYAQILKWAARRTARTSRRIIAISDEMQYWWVRTGSPSDCTPVIPLGVNLDRFHEMPAARELLRIPADLPVFLFAGRLSPEKGLLDLVRACSRACEWGASPFRLYVLGRGPLHQTLEREIRRLRLGDTIRIVPWVPQEQLSAWYSAADAYVLPSYTEGMSRTIPEALACGTPIIGSQISGTVDHVTNGRTGYLFPAGDIEQLARIMMTACQDPSDLRAMRPVAAAYATNELSWRPITRRVVDEVYRPVLAEGPHEVARPTVASSSLGPTVATYPVTHDQKND